ncbi:hypothetical protein [Noviherbaspirillum malthae]|uniref:hypothetical protein n=1 Tax=Noviherbaspirillum malthae TaxID=1260987 RepID=UPI00188E3E14|nr:hypothetical protein [Noviherbaspirillum malthae]
MKMRTRRRAYACEARHFQAVLWSRWKRTILSGLPHDVIQTLVDKGRSDWWIAGWATQPCPWVKGWPPPVKMRNTDSIRFAASCVCAASDDRCEPAIEAVLDGWVD